MRYWWTNKDAAIARFTGTLDEPDASAVFNDAWANSVASSIDRQRKTLIALIVASVVPTGYLALTLLNIKSEITISVIRIEDRASLFGIALLATCLLGLYGARVSIFAAQAEQLLSTWLMKRRRSHASFYEFAFGPSLFEPPRFTSPPGDLEPAPATVAFQGIARGFVALPIWVLALVVFVVQVWAVRVAVTTPRCTPNKGESAMKVLCAPNALLESLGYVCLVLTVANILIYVLYGVPYLHRERVKQTP